MAISDASVEVFNGSLSPFQISKQVNRSELIGLAEHFLDLTYRCSKKELPLAVNEALIELSGGINWREGRS